MDKSMGCAMDYSCGVPEEVGLSVLQFE